MRLPVSPIFGNYHVGAALDQRAQAPWHHRDVLVVPASVYSDAVSLGLADPEPSILATLLSRPLEPCNLPFFSSAMPAREASFSNVFESVPLTRCGLREAMRRIVPLAMLLRSLRQEAVSLSVAALRRTCGRAHPRSAVLASLASTSCRLDDIAESLRRPRRVVDKWLQRLREEDIVDYRRDIGWYLRADAAEPRP